MPERRDWSTLPSELLETIASKLSTNFVDIIRFGFVCTSWRSISLLLKQQSIQRNPFQCAPWLMLSPNETHRSFFSLSDNRVYWLELLNPSKSSWVCGSSNGWLVILDETHGMSLLNPITKTQIPLPPLTTLPGISKCLENKKGTALMDMLERVVNRVVVSGSKPNFGDGVVVILSASVIAICKNGSRSWGFVTMDRRVMFDDVYYTDGKLYVATRYGMVWVYDAWTIQAKPVDEIRPEDKCRADKNYLVESSGELLLVSRFRGWSDDLEKAYNTVWFRVSKRNGSSNGNWVEVKSLGDRSLFLGRNHSVSFVVPGVSGIKPNCIYFTDNISKDCASLTVELHDVGIFNLEDGSVEKLPGYRRELQYVSRPPMWVTTSPW